MQMELHTFGQSGVVIKGSFQLVFTSFHMGMVIIFLYQNVSNSRQNTAHIYYHKYREIQGKSVL